MFHPVHDDKDVGAAKRRRLNLKLEIRSNAENQAVTFMGLLAFYTKKYLLIDLKKKIDLETQRKFNQFRIREIN